ncbi:MAG TPA: HD domain-containing protein [Rhodothermales bacterium]|nr:HD domain-containing protein [Rhodothermales bacterium]
MESRFKIFSDPVHGFISVPRRLILDLVQTPEVQRLRRIRQLGVGYLVFPGAEHMRFGHALGAMALMQDALSTISEKGTPVSPEEYTAALAAALLHDVGHGPFSHTLEHVFVSDFHHEDMSRVLLLRLNEQFGGALDLAVEMFDGAYERPFFHQLVSSQLDMDRLDYLRRDSFYTGVVEGEVGVERIIKTMRVHPLEGGPGSKIVVESKGIYAVENFIIARRLMYWQVYLHKTVLAGDQLLGSLFRRVRRLLEEGGGEVERACSPALLFFLQNQLSVRDLAREDVMEHFCELDDTDVLYSLKRWRHAGDPVLSDLCRRFLNRDFFRVAFLPEKPSAEQAHAWEQRVADWMQKTGLSDGTPSEEEAGYYLAVKNLRHSAYERMDEAICIIDRIGRVRELSEMGDTSALVALTRSVVKPYVAYPKEVDLDLVDQL